MSKKPKRKPNTNRRTDWQSNDQLIEDTFLKLYLKKKKFPSFEDIAREMDVNVSTIKRHIKEIDFSQRFSRYRLGSGKVIANLFKHASTGKDKDMMRMWLELFEGLGAKKKVDITSDGKEIMIPITQIEVVHTNGAEAKGEQGS